VIGSESDVCCSNSKRKSIRPPDCPSVRLSTSADYCIAALPEARTRPTTSDGSGAVQQWWSIPLQKFDFVRVDATPDLL